MHDSVGADRPVHGWGYFLQKCGTVLYTTLLLSGCSQEGDFPACDQWEFPDSSSCLMRTFSICPSYNDLIQSVCGSIRSRLHDYLC